MQLMQRNNPHAPAQILPAHDNQVLTGAMGDCVSVIVLYNPVGGVYQNVRGYHGGGGLGNVNFNSLFNGVPNLPTTQIIMVSGTLQNSFYATTTNRDRMRQEANHAGLNNAHIHCRHGFPTATIDRHGNIT